LASQKLGQANGAKYSSREEGAHLEDYSEYGIIRELAAGIGAEIGCWPEPTGYLVQHMAGPLHIWRAGLCCLPVTWLLPGLLA